MLALSNSVESNLCLLGKSGLSLSEGYEYEVLNLYFASDVVVLNKLLDYFLNNWSRSLAIVKLWVPLELPNL